MGSTPHVNVTLCHRRSCNDELLDMNAPLARGPLQQYLSIGLSPVSIWKVSSTGNVIPGLKNSLPKQPPKITDRKKVAHP